MERIDRQIVQCLQYDGRASYRAVADVLGVSEQTVARRFRALHASGAVRVRARPDARMAGEQTWFVRIRCRPDDADPLAQAMAARDDVAWVNVASGGAELVCATRSAAGPVPPQLLPRTSQVLGFTACTVLHQHLAGAAPWLTADDPLSAAQLAALRPPRVTPAEGPPSTGILDQDAPLLAALARDGRAGVVALARATGWPQSRVSNRLTELLASGAVHVGLDLAPDHFGFHSTAHLWLTVPPAELTRTGDALARLPGTTFAAAVTGPANLLVTATCRDAGHLYSYVTTHLGPLPAVQHAEIVPVLRTLR